MKLGGGKNLRGFRVSTDSPDSTGEGPSDGGLLLPDRLSSENAVPVPADTQAQSGPADAASIPASDIDLPDQRSKLEDVYSNVQKVDPNRAAQIVAIKNRIDEPENFIDKNLDSLQKTMAAPSPSFFKELEEQYPGTAKWLSDPKNMAVSHDDLENAASHEGLIKSAESYLGSLYDAGKYGAEGSVSGLLYRHALADDKLAPKDPDVLQRFAMGAGSLAGDYPFMLAGGTAGTIAGATTGAVAGSPGGIPGIGLGIAAGGIGGAGVGGFGLPAALKTALEQKIRDGKITSYSDIVKEFSKQGLVGLLTAGIGAAAKAAFPATALGTKTVMSTAAPLAAEVGTMTVAGKAVEGKAPTWQDLIDSTLQVGAMHHITHLLENSVQDGKTQAAKEFYTALGNTAEASKLRDRLPEGYKDLVHQLTVDGPVENIYVPAEAAESYFQSKNIDPAAAMEELGVSKSYAEAKSTGGSVEIPLSTWASKIAGTEHYQGLADDVKFHPEDLTAREVEQRKSDIQEQVKSLLDERKAKDQAQADIESQTKKQEEASKVFQVIQDQLKAAGLSNPESQFNPQLHEAFFNTLGKHLGVAPEELAQRFPLSIARAEEPGALPEMSDERMAAQHQDGQSFDQSVYHGSPHVFDRFSLDKVGTGEGAQAYGHGLYFAGDKAVAEHYRNVLSKIVLKDAEGQDLSEVRDRSKNTARAILKQAFAAGESGSAAFRTARNDINAQLERAKEGAKDPSHHASIQNVKTYSGALKHLGELEKAGITAANQGRLYHVEIPEPHEFMDWDKPLSQQPEAIRRALSQLGDINENNKVIKTPSGDYGIADKENGYWDTEAPTFKSKKEAQAWLKDPTGEQFYEHLVRQNDGDQELASNFLRDSLGIPGLKYLDGSSRAEGEGSHNFVLFHDELAEIKSYEQSARPRDIQTEHALPEKVKVTQLEPAKVGAEPFKDGANKTDKKAYRDAAFKYARENFQGKEFENEHTGWDISVPRTALDRSKSHAVTPEMAAAFGHLDEILKSAVYLHSDADLKGRDEVKGFQYLYAPVESDGKSFVAKITVKDDGEKKFHVHDIEEVERPAGLTEPGSDASRSPVYGSPEISIEQLQSDINQVRERNPMFQGAPKLAEASPRGRIRIGQEGYAIDLFKNADRSTFLHETGHYFLDVMGHIASDENAPAQIKEDFQTILKWLGVDSKDAIGTDEHEKFARGFERYLMEGNAPSSALTRAFNRFRKWLTSVYQNVKSLNVDLSDDVRGVMDRMLASQEEIERAQNEIGLKSDSIPGIPPELEAKIQDLQSKARDQAESALLKEQMKETTDKHKEFLASERERLTGEAEKEVSELPLYKAMDEASLDIGRDKRSGEGDDTVSTGARAGTIAEKFLAEKLPPEDAGKFEALAEVHGFGSGEELAQHMIMAEEGKLRQREISMRVEAGMAPHADLMKTDAIRAEALKAIHSEKMTELLALEREAMSKLVHNASVNQEVSRRQRIEARVEAQAAKEQAREILSQKPIKDATNASKYVTAERSAAVKVAKALAKKDYEAAAEFKRQQMLNHAIASEAMKNKTAAEKSVSYLSDFAKRGNDLKDMPYGFMRQIDQLLTKSGFKDARAEDTQTLTQIAKDMLAKGEDPAEIANRTGFKQDQTGAWVPETLPDFVERVNGNYYPLTLPDSVMSGSAREYSDLTMSELNDLKASVKSIAEIGKKYDRFLGEFKTLDMKQASAELAKSIKEKFGTPFADETKAGSAYSSKFQEKIGSLKTLGAFFTRWLDTMYTTCHKLDGLEEGPAKDYIFRPFERATDEKSARTAQAMKEVEQIFSDHYDPKELKEYKESRVKVGDRYFSKENVLSMALNWGNEGNKSRLLSGIGLTQDQIEKAFSDHLDKTDWDFVQKTWDHIDKYWPEISKLEMDVNGVEPKKVQASAFTNQHGSYEGGYYPIAYDYDRSADAFKNAEQRDALYKQFSTAKAATEQGHTESRAQNVSRPLRLSLDVLTAHHEDVIHDLEFRKAVIDASRFLNQKEVKGALVEALGVRGYAGILEWVKAAASDGARQEPLNPWETAAQWLRMKNSVVSMGFKIASAPKIFLENINNVTSELGMTDAARAVSSYLTGSDMHEKVISQSDFMKQRANHLDRDMSDVMKKVQGERGPVQWATQHAFFVHAYMDQAFSFPLWNFVFDKAMEEHGEQARAVSQADEAVRRTFMSSGSVIDQPRIMRGSEYQKAMLVAYGYSSMMWNRFSLQAFDAKSQWIQGDRMAATATAAKAFVHTFMVPALVTSLVGALIHNSQSDNPDEKKKKIVADFLSDATPLSMIPVTRDLVRYGVNKMAGVHTSDLQLLPQEMAIQRLFTPFADVGMAVKSGQMNEKLPEHVANSISFVAGVPKEINDVVFNFLDYTKGDGELTYRDALSRKSKH